MNEGAPILDKFSALQAELKAVKEQRDTLQDVVNDFACYTGHSVELDRIVERARSLYTTQR
jgi:hypothetical protein